MTKDKKDSVGGVTKPTSVRKTQSVGGVSAVDKAEALERVRGVKSVDSVGSAKSVFSVNDRERLFKLIDEESRKLFPEESLSAKQRDIITRAVKMAIDSGLQEEDPPSTKKNTAPKK